MRATVFAYLATKHRETPIVTASLPTGELLVILASPGNATWTAVRVTPQGVACLVAAGEDWQGITVEPAGEDL